MVRNYLLICLFIASAYFVGTTFSSEVILGGDKAKIDQFPYQVSVQISDSNTCGGAIITAYHILTAAHCVVKNDGQFQNIRITIVAGTNNLQKLDSLAVTVGVKKIFVPTIYTPPVSNSTGDIAVLKLKEPLRLSKCKYVNKIELPKIKNETYDGQTAKISGFGWNWIRQRNGKEKGENSNTLRSLDVDIVNNSECQQLYTKRKISEKQICARVKQTYFFKRGVCIGDGGGPLVLDQTTAIGILSTGPKGCSEKIYPAIYTRISQYLTFIHYAINEKSTRFMRAYELSKDLLT